MLSLRFGDGDEAEISFEDGQRLATELDALGSTYAKAVAGTQLGGFQVDDENVSDIGRALEHLYNLEEAKTTRDARKALFSKVRWSPITYVLRSWEIEGEGKVFFSYTGEYGEGDRLVTLGGDAFRVVRVDKRGTPAEDGVLTVERYRRTRSPR